MAPEAERRQLTVMFCDLVGSTALSEQLDPEELREVVRTYQDVCADVITHYEGQIAQYLSDGLLVYFGYPQAHEDDAQRAVRAGLGIVEALQHAPLLQVRDVQVRLGIHTGLVVVGEIGGGNKREQLALGETPNIAARLQGLTQPNTVVMSAATYHLVNGLFECRDLGAQPIKGLSLPMQVYQVMGESGVRSRFEIALTAGLTPLVGREEEVGLLRKRWEQANEGLGQVVFVSGEAGIGKSRLLQVLRERLAGQPQTWLECRCSPYYQNSALYPLIDLLERTLGFQREETSEEKLTKLERALEQYGLDLKEAVSLFTALLSLSSPRFPLPLSTPQRQKQKMLEVLVAWVLKEAERQPLCFVVEDAHWADPSTLEFLRLLFDQTATAHLLIILTFRPEFLFPWTLHSYMTQLTLSRLGRSEVEEMVARVTGGKPLPLAVEHEIALKTDGVPLFVEELTKMVLESGLLKETGGRYELIGPLPPLAIPATLQDSLVARLDRLAAAREVAQIGATIGREFSYEVLHSISPIDDMSLRQALAKLVETELLYQRGVPPHAHYVFKHALVQDAAYQSLLKSKRQYLHQQIAQVLEERLAETKDTPAELLAHHYTEAGLIVQAIPYWQQAGQRATQQSAHIEAIRHLTRGLELLNTLPDTPERAEQELKLQIALGPPLQATKGFSDPAVGTVYARTRELCRRLGETPQLFSVLQGLRLFYLSRAEHKTARELAEQLLTLARRQQNPRLLVGAHMAMGQAMSQIGELVLAREHLEQGIALYDPRQHHSSTSRGEYDPGVGCRCLAGLALWSLGYPDQALKQSQEALSLAQELSHPFSLALALNVVAGLHLSRGEARLIQERVEAAMVLSAEQGFSYWAAIGTITRGWVLVERGQVEEGILQLHQSVSALRAMGTELMRPYFLGLLAEAHRKMGQIQEGLSIVAEGLELVHTTGEYRREADLYRLKGELTLQQLNVEGSQFTAVNLQYSAPNLHAETEAEECFHTAINIAQRQQAKSMELQAVMSLSWLWQYQGKKEEARKLLAEIYGWFTEGFDTKDLQEAKALLDELSEE